jgi:hypothetical protein
LNSLKTSWRVAAVLQVPNNFVVAKKPLPLKHLYSLRKTLFQQPARIKSSSR